MARAKKQDSACEGNLIQIKRTNLSIHSEEGKTKIDSDNSGQPLRFGEPLLLNNSNDDYLIFGDGVTQTSKISKVFKAIPKSQANWLVFYDQNTIDNASQMTLIDQNGNKLYEKFHYFTEKDAAGKTEVRISTGSASEWFKVDQNTGKITNIRINWSSQEDINYFPKAQRIKVSGMKDTITPFIGLSLTYDQLRSKTKIKEAKKVFGNISAVFSENDNIVVYCGYKNLKEGIDLYLDVFGG